MRATSLAHSFKDTLKYVYATRKVFDEFEGFLGLQVVVHNAANGLDHR